MGYTTNLNWWVCRISEQSTVCQNENHRIFVSSVCWGNLGEHLQDRILDVWCSTLQVADFLCGWDVQMKFTWVCKPDSLHEQFKGNIGKSMEYLDIYRQHIWWTWKRKGKWTRLNMQMSRQQMLVTFGPKTEQLLPWLLLCGRLL